MTRVQSALPRKQPLMTQIFWLIRLIPGFKTSYARSVIVERCKMSVGMLCQQMRSLQVRSNVKCQASLLSSRKPKRQPLEIHMPARTWCDGLACRHSLPEAVVYVEKNWSKNLSNNRYLSYQARVCLALSSFPLYVGSLSFTFWYVEAFCRYSWQLCILKYNVERWRPERYPISPVVKYLSPPAYGNT